MSAKERCSNTLGYATPTQRALMQMTLALLPSSSD